MTRFEFMYRLEQGLQDISLEEREEALKYYEEYIADAGTLSDDQLVKEFGMPEKVAAMIKADLSSKEKQVSEPEDDSKIYTERGFEDTQYSELKFEVTGEAKQADNNSDSSSYKADENEQNFGSEFDSGQFHSSGSSYGYNAKTEQTQNNGGKGISGLWSNKILWIILCIFFIPVFARIIFGLFTGLFGAAAAIILTVVSIIFILLFCSGGFILSGVIIVIFGIVRMLRFPVFEGLFYSGMGVLLFGIGMLLLPMTTWVFKIGIPLLWHVIKNFFGRIFRHRRGTL